MNTTQAPCTNLSIIKIKTFNQLNALYEHNESIERRNLTSNVNTESGVCRSLLDSDLNYEEKWHNRIEDAEIKYNYNIKARSNATLALGIVTHVPYELKDSIDLNAWMEDVKQYLFEYFGKENVIGLTLHTDEVTPHLHAVIVPVDKETGHLHTAPFIGGKGKLAYLQSQYAKRMEKYGMQRGVYNSKKASRAKYDDLKRLYRSLNNTLDKKLPEKTEEESLEEYYNRLNNTYHDLLLKLTAYEDLLRKEKTRNIAYTQKYHYGIKFQNILHDIFGESDTIHIINELETMPLKDVENLFKNVLKATKEKKKKVDEEQNKTINSAPVNLESVLPINNTNTIDNTEKE